MIRQVLSREQATVKEYCSNTSLLTSCTWAADMLHAGLLFP